MSKIHNSTVQIHDSWNESILQFLLELVRKEKSAQNPKSRNFFSE